MENRMERQRQFVTGNGVKVLSYRQGHLHSFCIGLYAKAGVLYEKPGETGVTHFLEHALFRNLAGMPQRELYEKLEAMGATFDACTYKEFVCFTIIATTRHFDGCADIIARLLAPLSVTKADVDVERKRVQNEIREDDPLGDFDHTSKRIVWRDQPLSRPITGTITGVAKIGLEQLREARDEIFRAQNLCFYVTGNFSDGNLERLRAGIERYDVAGGRDTRRTVAPLPADFQNRGAAVILRGSADMPGVYYSFDVDYSRYAMAEINLLDDMLFRGTLSRFNMALSEDSGLVYGHDACVDQYRNGGTLYVKYSVMQSKLYESLRVATRVFRSMKEHIDETELGYHLPKYYDNYDLTMDDPEDLNWHMAFNNFILDHRLESIEQIKGMYRAVTPARLMEISREVFRAENLVVVIRCRRGRCREERVREILSTL
jgi:predicted Zn-dependent peptidase